MNVDELVFREFKAFGPFASTFHVSHRDISLMNGHTANQVLSDKVYDFLTNLRDTYSWDTMIVVSDLGCIISFKDRAHAVHFKMLRP